VYMIGTLLCVFCVVDVAYLRMLLGGTYLDFLKRIYASCKIYLNTLHKVDTLASFIGQLDLLASCAVYSDILYRVSSTSRQHMCVTSTAEFSEKYFGHGTLCTLVNI
jgi:hypothetical protein